MEFRILGPLEVAADGERVELGPAKARSVLALLLVSANRVVSIDHLVEELWEGSPPDQAGASLRVHVSRLRKVLRAAGSDAIETRPPGYLLRVNPGDYDAAVFESLVREGRGLLVARDAEAASQRLNDALAMWRGPAFADVSGPPSIHAEAARLDDARLAALEDRVEADLACGRHSSLAAELDALTTAHPLRERLWGQRILALYRCGRQADSLRAYQSLRTILGDQLGIEPSPALRRLEQDILGQSPSLDWVAPAPTSAPASAGAPTSASPAATADASGRAPTAPSATAPTPAAPAAVEPALPSGVVTFLLTDVEGSTSLWDQYPDDMATALARHDELVGGAVRAHEGTLLKTRGEGDSTFSVFTRATDAAAAALDVARALAEEEWPGPCVIKARIALHTGEAYQRDGDYYGPIVNRAARLRGVASGGQIVLSQSTAELVVDHIDDVVLVELGHHELRGLARPERVYQLAPMGAPETLEPAAVAPVALPLPAGLALGQAGTFVGRAPEQARLHALWEEVAAGNRRTVFIAGEPGIGKTRLAAELAVAAYRGDALVLYGRCDEEALAPYQPFVEALRDFVLRCPVDVLRGHVQALGGELVRLLPQLEERLPNLPPPLRAEPETERYRLFEAISALVTGMAAPQPVCLVLDDLQWADKPTLLLLRHLLRSATPCALLVVGCYRDSDLTRMHPLADVLADLRRDELVERVALIGLTQPEVGAFSAAVAGREIDDTFVAALHRETDGNPFFVGEVLRHMVESGWLADDDANGGPAPVPDALGIPEGIREVIGRRLRRLSPEANTVLTLASVVGRTFEIDVVEHVSELPPSAVLEALEEAITSRLVVETPNDPTRYAFAHALVRDTLYGELTTARRVRMHRQVAETLERLHGDDPRHLADLARHFFEAAQAGTIDKAVEYLRGAGDRAIGLLAYEEAAAHYDRALQALDLDPKPNQERRGRLLLALGDAWWRAGEPDRAREAIVRAIDLGRALRDPQLMAQAALGLGSPHHREGPDVSGEVDDARVALLEETLAALPPEDSPLRARLLGRLAVARYWAASRDERDELTRDAVAMARRTGDVGALLGTLVSRRFALSGPEDVEERMAVATELLALAEQSGDAERALEARVYRIGDLLELGDVARADPEIERYREQAEHLRQPWYIWYGALFRATRALMDGRFADAEQLATEAVALGDRARDPNALQFYGTQMLWAWREQGRTAELESFYQVIFEASAAIPAAQAALCWVAADVGRLDEARERFEQLAADDFASLPRDLTWLAGIALVTLVCHALSDAPRAKVLYGQLEPYSHRNVMPWPIFYMGPVDYYKGLLAATAGDFEAARGHFETALASSEATGARPFVAHAQADLGALLVEHGPDADRVRGTQLLERALATARELGMAPLEEWARARMHAATSG